MKKLTKDVWLETLTLGLVVGIWLLWAFILPLNEGPDENMRLQIVEFILEYGKLPTGYQKEIMDYTWGFTYGFRPILPQMLEALFVRFSMIFTKDPFELLFAGRLASVFCGIVFLGYVRALGHMLFEKKIHQWLFLLLNLCLPQSSLLFSYLNCDSMALMASAMILYYLLKGRKDSFSTGTCVWLGVSLSVCVLSYYNAYGFLVTAAFIFVGYFWEQSRREESCWKEFWGKGLLICGFVLALTGWWFVRNYFLYDGDFLGLRTQEEYAQRYALDMFKPSGRRNCINQGISLFHMLFHSDWVVSVFKSFVGILAPLTEAHRAWIFVGYGLLFLAGGVGVIWECCQWAWKEYESRGQGKTVTRTRDMRKRGVREKIVGKKCVGKLKVDVGMDVSQIMFHMGLITAVLLPNVLNVWYSYSNDYQPQGRYSMPMLVPFMYYVVKGMGVLGEKVEQVWENRRVEWMELAGKLACLWMMFVLGYCTVRIMWPAYRDVEDKAEVRLYTMEELYGERE